MWLMLLFLIFLPILSDSLYCLGPDNSITLKKNDSNLANIEKEIRKLEIDVETKICVVKIEMAHKSGIFRTVFDRTYAVENVKPTVNVKALTSYYFMKNNSNTSDSVTNSLTIECGQFDGCDRQFLLDHIKWVVQGDYKQLDTAIGPLMFDGSDVTVPGECILVPATSVQSCSNETHGWIHVGVNKTCRAICKTISETRMKISIETEMSIRIYTGDNQNQQKAAKCSEENMIKIYQRIEYHCSPDHCDKPMITENIMKAVDDYYDLSAIYKVLMNKTQDNLATANTVNNSLTTITSLTTTIVTTSSTNTVTSSQELDGITINPLLFSALITVLCSLLF